MQKFLSKSLDLISTANMIIWRHKSIMEFDFSHLSSHELYNHVRSKYKILFESSMTTLSQLISLDIQSLSNPKLRIAYKNGKRSSSINVKRKSSVLYITFLNLEHTMQAQSFFFNEELENKK